VRAIADIGGPLVTSVPAGTLGRVVEIRRRRRVMVSFANGRTLEVGRSLVGPVQA
jgi:hypothetical protein